MPDTAVAVPDSDTRTAVVCLTGARLAYPGAEGEVEVLRGVDMTVEQGEILAVTGPSGSGKSSLIALIGGLEAPTGGTVMVLDRDMGTADETERTRLRRRDIGVVFQAYHLVPAMTALQNVALPLILAGVKDARDHAAAMLDRVGLGHRLSHRPSALSGGEQQRVAVARAFIAEPRLILADEPTGNLDQKTGAGIAETMFDLCRETGAAMLLVTHDPTLADRCDRRLEIDTGRVAA
jgi:putative ABC transport system ATP-binding protein